MRKNLFIPVILFIMMSTGCGITKSVQIDNFEQKENTQNAENKTVTWCDKRTMKESKETFHEGNLWISSEYFNGTNHAPTVRHFCHGDKEIFTLEMEWDDNTSLHKGKLILSESKVTLPISSKNKDPEVQFVEENNKENNNQVWFTLDGRTFLFDRGANKFIENPTM